MLRAVFFVSFSSQQSREFVLDIADQAEPAEHERGVELDQRGAGLDLCQSRRPGIHAADPDQRKRAIDPHEGFVEPEAAVNLEHMISRLDNTGAYKGVVGRATRKYDAATCSSWPLRGCWLVGPMTLHTAGIVRELRWP